VRYHAIKFRSQLGAFCLVGNALLMGTESDFLREFVKFWGGADEFGCALYDVGEVAIAS